MAGVILLLLGVARMGAVIKFIPAPVIVGFTAGIGVIIWVGQWKDFFGLSGVTGAHFHQTLWQLLQALPHLPVAPPALAVISLTLLILSARLPSLPLVSAPLVAQVV